MPPRSLINRMGLNITESYLEEPAVDIKGGGLGFGGIASLCGIELGLLQRPSNRISHGASRNKLKGSIDSLKNNDGEFSAIDAGDLPLAVCI